MMPTVADRRSLRDISQGILVAITAGYSFVLLILAVGIAKRPASFSARDLGGLLAAPLLTFGTHIWFALSIGAVAGLILPHIVRRRSFGEVLIIAALASVGIGLLWVVWFSMVLTIGQSGDERSASREFAIVLAPWLAAYSLPWLATFGALRRNSGTA